MTTGSTTVGAAGGINIKVGLANSGVGGTVLMEAGSASLATGGRVGPAPLAELEARETGDKGPVSAWKLRQLQPFNSCTAVLPPECVG